VNRPFYIVSRLPMQRVIQAQGNNNIALNRWKKEVRSNNNGGSIQFLRQLEIITGRTIAWKSQAKVPKMN